LEGSKAINIFLAKIFGFYFFWLLSENYLTHNFVFFNTVWSFFYHVLLVIVNNSSAFFLELMGYEVVHNYRSVAIVGSYGVVVGNHCVGFGLSYGCFALFTSYPALNKVKLWFVPLSIFLIVLSNVIRVVALTIATFNNPKTKYTDQHDLFNYVIYLLVFVLWIIWIQYIVPTKQKK
jgi:exosortase/archaeosortase family protein